MGDRSDATLVQRGANGDAAALAMEALAELSDAERAVAERFYLHGLTISEIAQRRRCPEGTVKRRLFTAREHMRRTLGIAPRS